MSEQAVPRSQAQAIYRFPRCRPCGRDTAHKWTPWARAEYELSLEPCEDAVERARRFYCAACMSFNGATQFDAKTYGWRHTLDYNMRPSPALDMVNNALQQISDRLLGVQIESRDYADVINRFDRPVCLIYFDPPYVAETRNKTFWYGHEFTEQDHTQAAALLRQCAGYVVVSGYACPLYADLYEAHGWHRVDKEAQTNSGGKRIESLWLSPRTVEALAMPAQLTLGV